MNNADRKWRRSAGHNAIPTADWNQELQQFNRASHKWNNVLLTIGYVVCLGAVAYLGLWLAGAP